MIDIYYVEDDENIAQAVKEYLEQRECKVKIAIFGFVALAYYIGGKRILKCNLADALRNDSME